MIFTIDYKNKKKVFETKNNKVAFDTTYNKNKKKKIDSNNNVNIGPGYYYHPKQFKEKQINQNYQTKSSKSLYLFSYHFLPLIELNQFLKFHLILKI